MMARRVEIAIVVLVVGLLALVPYLGGNFYTVQFTRILVYAIFAMSLDLLVGYAGLVSMGHAAFFGVAAYTTAMLATKAGVYSLLVLVPASIATAALSALVIGVLSVRTTNIYFIMVTLAFSQIVFYIVHDVRVFGGSDGLLLEGALHLEIAGYRLVDLGNRAARFYVTLGAALLVYVFLRCLVDSLFGRVIRGIKSNERRMRALGFSVVRYKLAAFVIAGALAGLAGVLNVGLTGQTDPSIVDWLESAKLLMMVILGGLGTLYGPCIGAAALILLVDQLSELTDHWKLGVGAVIVAFTLLAPGGLVGIIKWIGTWRPGRAPGASAREPGKQATTRPA